MNKGIINELIKELEKVKHFFQSNEVLALQVLLFIVFLFVRILLSIFGIGYILLSFCIYLLFAIIVYLFSPVIKINVWIIPTIGLLVPILLFLATQNNKKEVNNNAITDTNEIKVPVYDKRTIEANVKIFGIFEGNVKYVESEPINTPIQNSRNPIEIHHIIGSMGSIPNDKLDYYYNLLNGIIERYERDSIHFSIDPMYLDSQWDKCYNYGEVPVPFSLFESYHNEYIGLIPVVYVNRGVVFDRMGYPEKALEDYDKALTFTHSLFTWLESNYRERLEINRALAYAHLKNYNKALEILDNRISIEESSSYFSISNYSELQYNKGYIFLLMKDYDNAINCYEKAVLKMEPNSDPYIKRVIYNYLGITYNQMGKTDEAILAFTNAIQSVLNWGENFKEDAIPYYYNRSLVYRTIGNNDLADSDEETINQIKEEVEKRKELDKIRWSKSIVDLYRYEERPFKIERWW